jgi:hypothetical protein
VWNTYILEYTISPLDFLSTAMNRRDRFAILWWNLQGSL